MPGTPSISAGRMTPCQWMLDISLRRLRTRRVTVSPSRNRSTGAGTAPFTAVAIRRWPVKLPGGSAIWRSNSAPRNSAVAAAAGPASSAGETPATAPLTARPWTKRRRVAGKVGLSNMVCSRFVAGGLGEVEDDAALDVAVVHAREDVVDLLERFGVDSRVNLALAGEGQRLHQVEPGADDRAADGDAVEHGVEDRQRKIAGRQAIEGHRAAAPDHAERLLEGLGRDGGDEDALRAADRRLDRGGGILLSGVDGHGRGEACRQIELAVVDVDRRHVEPHRLGVLHGHVTQAADAGDHDPLARLGLGRLQSLVDGNARAQYRP